MPKPAHVIRHIRRMLCRHRGHVPDGVMLILGQPVPVRRCCRCQARLAARGADLVRLKEAG